MPASLRDQLDAIPEKLQAFHHHGVDLSVKGSQASGDCPFCGADGKFTVNVDTGLWRCWVCGGADGSGGGNPLGFIRAIYERGAEGYVAPAPVATPVALRPLRGQTASKPRPSPAVNGTASPPPDGDSLAALAADRRLHSAAILSAWGVVRSPIYPNPWLIAGYNTEGRIDQVYKRVLLGEGYRLLPTPGIWPDGKAHALHLPVNDFDPERERIVICEGPWDGMALWETERDVWGAANIIAVPGATVWREEWTKLCHGKHVVLLFDSDHPRKRGNYTARAGYDGMVRVAKMLAGIAASIKWVQWGPEGYDEAKPSGWDVRDHLTGAPGPTTPVTERSALLADLLSKVVDLPAEMLVGVATNGKAHGTGIEPERCQTWTECIGAWEEAMRWRATMSDVMAVLLATCASTQQAGNQIFVQVIGNAGSGKTTMCEGLLVSHHCHHLEHLTGFHSGWKGETNPDGSVKDCSLIARINGKTLITPEADIMMSSPRFDELMSQQRRIFDGKSGATYKNSGEDTLYVGLRTPWIMAGTPALLDKDQSRLGDRFLRVIIEEPSETEKRAILRSALRSERMAMLETANGTAGSIIDGKTRKAHALTGGYVNWLRANVDQRLPGIMASVTDEQDDECADLAELCADLRARPNEDKKKKEVHDCKELPTRLSRQSIRLAAHLAVVFNKRSVDAEVMRIVRKVALDTASGHSLTIASWLFSRKPGSDKTHQECGGITGTVLQTWTGMSEERLLNYLTFLRKIDVLEFRESRFHAGAWLLTERVVDLYTRVLLIGS